MPSNGSRTSVFRPRSFASASASAGEARVSAGARVGPRAVLGRGCEIGEGAEVAGSVLLAECRVGDEAVVREAILAQRVEVPAGGAVDPGTVVGEGEVIAG